MLKFKIADIHIHLTYKNSNLRIVVDNALKSFFVSDGIPDIILNIHFGDLPSFELGEKIFDTNSIWSLYRNSGKYILLLHSKPMGESPYKLAVFDYNFRYGDIYISDKCKEVDQNPAFYPFDFPLNELLMVNFLSANKSGIMVHGSCVNYNGRGLLFTGFSGAGKSTMAEIWQGEKGVNVINDERIVIRKTNGTFTAYGTPWHGTSQIFSPEEVAVDKIFFLRHAFENTATPRLGARAASALLARSFPTFYHRAGMNFALTFCGDIIQSIPCYDLGFVPNKSIIQTIRTMKN